ncbi:MAG: methyl-accepting chemotaxis protein, partial [Pacificimonas sp.]
IMFDKLSHTHVKTEDSRFLELTKQARDDVVDIVTVAVRRGELAMEDVYDRDYRLRAGTNPKQYDNRFNLFADANIRPILDTLASADPTILATSCADVNGYLPTHLSRCSAEPRGDPEWDGKNCRNRRIFMDDITERALRPENRDFMIGAYRMDDGKGGQSRTVKSLFLPLFFDDRRWGNFEIAYTG